MDTVERLVDAEAAFQRRIDGVADDDAGLNAEGAERPLLEGDRPARAHCSEEIGTEMPVELGTVERGQRRGFDGVGGETVLDELARRGEEFR